jgi:hypothetical protein
MRLLSLKIQEPLPGMVLPEMAAIEGPEEAARRYRAIAVTTLRQLRGLADARLRLVVTPDDAHEAIRFWLLPRLAERWSTDDGIFRAAGWEIDFGGSDDEFPVRATGEILCPFLSARWVHAGLLGLGHGVPQVIGPGADGGEYLSAHADQSPTAFPPRILPELPIIQTHDHWTEALESTLGPALKRAWEEETG